ncbi:Bestrophin, RFP-TM, chloride channel-domain-containing protein [Schizophyllum amplum]|uniref:Bestrophin, RFP-TM, chloride channel-domain-containing protein n=1 Tax=Schizophyllum amplum TaxID=97359 RepID=A0A550BTD5_9AGAR|nr:Bestrophin, RFP-TM, chloride channel-domain-containing protein [Auriculariopsis ampla]
MVAVNPLFRGRWTLKRFNATVINDIWPEVFFFSLIATMVACVSELTSHTLGVSNALLTVLGTVLGLVISFRTSTAYERYQDGRKMWTNITIASRNLAQMMWIHVSNDRPAKDNKPATSALKCIIEKKSMINLVQAFSVSVKHQLRGEPGIYYQDLYPLLCFLPRYASTAHTDADMTPLWWASEEAAHPMNHTHDPNPRAASDDPHGPPLKHTASLPDAPGAQSRSTTVGGHAGDDARSEKSWMRSLGRGKRRQSFFDPEKALPDIQPHRPLRPARSPPNPSFYDYLPVFRLFRYCYKIMVGKKKEVQEQPIGGRNILGRKVKPEAIDSNVPFEICLYLSTYTAFLMRRGLVQPAIATGLSNALGMLQDTVTNLDRIRSTPLPFAYQAHLRMSLWLYLLFLPFQLYPLMNWFTIPGTAFASFLLLGFLEIGQEIENPFNYDENDLDLDGFCLSIQRELHEITAHTSPEPDDFVFSMWNQPFAPADRRTAHDLVAGNKDYTYPAPGTEDVGTKGPEPGLASVRRALLKGWRDVDLVTRDL